MPKQFCPTPRELDDLELLTNGALAPLTAFNQPGSPITLTLPDDLAEEDEVELVDPEGLPLARVTTATGEVELLARAEYGPFRRLYLTPAQVREQYAGRTFVALDDALYDGQLANLRDKGPLVLLAMVGHRTPALSAPALLRATLVGAAELPDAVVVAVPAAFHGHEFIKQVALAYAGGDPLISPGIPDALSGRIAEIADHDQLSVDRSGLVLFFTGLSGSGKSTLARALMDRILESTDRTVTSLDGDVVRRNLSAGLTFSREDRETNIRRIGWVAAEIARHHGLAVCSPIAPFAKTRAQVREMVEDAGGVFFLVHVATPLEECERRDRKGLYAKARAGEIPEFTGISSPYEEPDDAAVRVDTTGRTIGDALDDVIEALHSTGHLKLKQPSAENEPLKILFVCTANICRSPYMELWARKHLAPDSGLEFGSAGTHAEDGRPMDPTMAAQHPGLDDLKPAFRSKRLTRTMIGDADLVLTAEAAHRDLILAEQPEAFRKVFTLGQAANGLQEAGSDLTGRTLLAFMTAHRVRTASVHDIADPYRQGAAAARAAADAIDGHLKLLLPRLAAHK